MERHVVFRSCDQIFALPLAATREVVLPPQTFTRVPRAPTFIRGVMNLRGRIVTVVDFERLLSIPLGTQARDPLAHRLVLLEAKRRELALFVDAVLGIERLMCESAAPSGSASCTGLARRQGEPVTLLGLEPLLEVVHGHFDPRRSG